MPAMTMPFKVKDVTLLEGRMPGDIIEAKLVVTQKEAYLTDLVKTGFDEPISIEPLKHPTSGVPLLKKGDVIPNATFIDQDNHSRKLGDFRGNNLILTFTYTRCPLPNFCPLMDLHFNTLQEEFKKAGDLSHKTKLLSISLDPVFDTPEVLKKHGDALQADYAFWNFLTGDRESIINFAEQFGFTIIQDGGEAVDITHNLRTVIIDASGILIKIYKGNEWTPDDILQELTHLSHQN